MKYAKVFMLVWAIVNLSACTTESLKRTGYETLQNIQEQQCRKELSSECPKRESYEAYQQKTKTLDESEK